MLINNIKNTNIEHKQMFELYTFSKKTFKIMHTYIVINLINIVYYLKYTIFANKCFKLHN